MHTSTVFTAIALLLSLLTYATSRWRDRRKQLTERRRSVAADFTEAVGRASDHLERTTWEPQPSDAMSQAEEALEELWARYAHVLFWFGFPEAQAGYPQSAVSHTAREICRHAKQLVSDRRVAGDTDLEGSKAGVAALRDAVHTFHEVVYKKLDDRLLRGLEVQRAKRSGGLLEADQGGQIGTESD